MKKLELGDLYRLRLVSDAQISPSGKFIAFTVARMDRKKNDYLSRIYLWRNGIREFTSGEKDSGPRFTKDERYIVYLSSRDKKIQLRRISLEGGESKIILEREKIADHRVDGEYVYFLAPDIKKEKDDVKRITHIPFYFNGKGFIYNARMHLYRVPLNGGKVEKLTDGDFDVVAYDVKDGLVAYATSEDETRPYMHNLYIWRDGRSKKISKREANIAALRISPDKKRIAVFLKFREKSLLEHSKLHFIDIEGGDYIKACDLDLPFGNALNSDVRFSPGNDFQWISNKEILFVVTEGGCAPIYLYADGKCTKYLGGKRSVESFTYANGILAFTAQDAIHPPELFVRRGNKERRLTNLNRFLKNRGLKEPEEFTFKSSDGESIDGWIIPGEGERYPLILEIHGGPKTAYGYGFMFEFHYLNSLGFGVVFTNPRGSAGYSEKFAVRIQGKYGEREYQDLMEAMDYVIKNYPVDTENLFVTGGSYGGFMTNWIVGHTSRFRAAVTQRSISNQISFWGTSDIGPWFAEDQIGSGKNLWDALLDYWEKSPLKYARNVKTPLLIIHSEEDYRCPVEQAYQLFYALKMQKKEVKMVLFPEENHDLSRSGKPKHREVRLEEISKWFLEHMKRK